LATITLDLGCALLSPVSWSEPNGCAADGYARLQTDELVAARLYTPVSGSRVPFEAVIRPAVIPDASRTGNCPPRIPPRYGEFLPLVALFGLSRSRWPQSLAPQLENILPAVSVGRASATRLELRDYLPTPDVLRMSGTGISDGIGSSGIRAAFFQREIEPNIRHWERDGIFPRYCFRRPVRREY